MSLDEHPHDEWWLATAGNLLIWARLRIRDADSAEVFDSDGNTLPFDGPDSARAALLDAEFVALDGMDEDDARARGFSLAALSPPDARNDDALRTQMVQKLPHLH